MAIQWPSRARYDVRGALDFDAARFLHAHKPARKRARRWMTAVSLIEPNRNAVDSELRVCSRFIAPDIGFGQVKQPAVAVDRPLEIEGVEAN